MEFSWPEITSGTKQSLSVAVFRQAALWSGGGIHITGVYVSAIALLFQL